MSNRFALLSDDASDTESSGAPVKAAPAPAAKSSTPAGAAAKQNAPRTKSDYPSRGAPRKVYGGDRPLAGNDATESDLSKDNRAERTAGQRGGRGSGSRGPRGGRGGRGSGGNRPLDRHSQTDRVDSHKQEHQAWGGDEGKRELQDESRGVEDALADASGVATPVNGEASSSPAPIPEENAAPAEPEDNTKTYDQWLAEQTDKTLNVALPTLEARQANEGADDAQWKDAVPLSRKDQEDEEAFYAGSGKDAVKTRKRPQKEGKTYIEVEPRFQGPARGGRGGDRGSFRGRGRGGDRGGRGAGRGNARSDRPSNNSSSVDTSDASAFPSLS